MRFGVVLYNLGKICLVLAAAMVLPMTFELVKREAVMGALLSAQLVMLGLGGGLLLLFKKDSKTPLRNRESCGIATFAWLRCRIFLATPVARWTLFLKAFPVLPPPAPPFCRIWRLCPLVF